MATDEVPQNVLSGESNNEKDAENKAKNASPSSTKPAKRRITPIAMDSS